MQDLAQYGFGLVNVTLLFGIFHRLGSLGAAVKFLEARISKLERDK